MSKFSPATKAVLESTACQVLADRRIHMETIAAAALRAAIDELIPEAREGRLATLDEKHRKVSVANIRAKFQDVIAELEKGK